MNRYCFLLQVRPESLPEYRARHAQVWPDMLQALAESGWHNYSIFARPDGLLVGYVEAEDLDAAQAAMAATEVNARWQAEMAAVLPRTWTALLFPAVPTNPSYCSMRSSIWTTSSQPLKGALDDHAC